MAEVWMPTGFPQTKIVKPSPAGWVDLGKLGQYKLAVAQNICKCGHAENHHTEVRIEQKDTGPKKITTLGGTCQECTCPKFEFDHSTNYVRRWGRYPERPFLKLWQLQVPIRKESFFYNNPEPITPPEERIKVTATDAALLVRQLNAQETATEIVETQALEKQLLNTVANLPNKMVLYIGIVGILVADVVILIILHGMGG
jgi:hypothetical protein